MDKTKQLYSLMTGASQVSVAVHTHPDGDAAGSGLALVGYLRDNLGKDAVLLVPDSIPESLGFLPEGFPKDAVMVFDDEEEAVTARIGTSDLIFCLDCSSFSRTSPGMEKALRDSTSPKVLVDHHLNPEAEAFSLVFSETRISSTCELLYGLLKDMPGIDGDLSKLPMASLEAILAGLTTDTNNFANSVFPGTLDTVSELLEAGVDRDRILSCLYNNYRENRLRLMGEMLRTMEITSEGVALMILDKATQERFGFRQGESEGFVNMPLAVGKVRMSIFLTEEEGRFRVSVRSKKGVSANGFASRYFHGGGHEQAAGGKLFFPEDIPSPCDAKAYILKVTGEFFDE